MAYRKATMKILMRFIWGFACLALIAAFIILWILLGAVTTIMGALVLICAYVFGSWIDRNEPEKIVGKK